MGAILKWGGLAGSILLVASAVLETLGQSEAANALKGLGGLFGSSVPAGEITGAVLAGASVLKKLYIEYKRVKGV